MNKRKIIKLLAHHRQRATYGALAEVVGGIPLGVMRGERKTQENSWIVNEDTSQPTDYEEDEKSPHLCDRPHVITTGDELSEWLKNPH